MTAKTRDQLIETARQLFARKGFYGTSIAAIAGELGLTKQALLHHFGSKEKLYGEVLRDISDNLLQACEDIADTQRDPALLLEELVLLQFRSQMADQDVARLIMRELLDNDQRAQSAGNWYLKPYLDALVDAAVDACAAGNLGRGTAVAMVYQLLGAAHYFAVSQPTLRQIFGQPLFDQACAGYEQQLRQLIRAQLQVSGAPAT